LVNTTSKIGSFNTNLNSNTSAPLIPAEVNPTAAIASGSGDTNLSSQESESAFGAKSEFSERFDQTSACGVYFQTPLQESIFCVSS